ncbi:MAG: pirin family protein [Saprospiraceae bacterium]|nr:pirin family protein [Saprospiraceae bacterium]MBK7812731.1 pirin family protein [Saprospiraceae bacterium]MBK9630922.1 pirin family protein [Saprospiraceae bacterium]
MELEKRSRRGFVTKVSVGVLAWLGLSNSRNVNIIEDISEPTFKNPIRDIKPMGFNWDTMDPFLFCVHHEDFFPKGNDELGPVSSLKGRTLGDDFIIKDGWRMYHGKKVPGFPGHPHRGFETITVVRKGMVDHADSMGASGRYGEGDVQWMTAGKGVQHSEMFPLLKKDEDNPLELFQIWLNLPKRNKMVDPHFKMLWGSSIPKIKLADSQNRLTEIEIMAGQLNGASAPAPPPNSWASDPGNEVAIYNIRMDPNTSFKIPKASEGVNRMVYFYIGEQLTANGTTIPKYHSAYAESTVDLELKSGSTECKILILQGRPINEPIIQYGPFVMNTKQEIQQAFDDFHATKFGGWPWSRYDQVHDRNEGRFARHADGKYEEGA